MNIRLHFILILVLYVSCTRTVSIKNEREGKLVSRFMLEQVDEKKFALDSATAPIPQYAQFFEPSEGMSYFTFLNMYSNSICFYDYNTMGFLKKITYSKEGPDGIKSPYGYYIKNMDSIYVYDKIFTGLLLTNSMGKVQAKIDLTGGKKSNDWYLYYPQYYPQTVNSFIEADGKLLLSGQYFFSIPESIINGFKFNAQIDLKTNKVQFKHTYPEELYGSNYNWEGGFYTGGFTELHPDGDKLIFSFPVSHDLYIAGIGSDNYEKNYAGSNEAGTIRSLEGDRLKTTREIFYVHFARQDVYTAILFDKYRQVYYRFLLKSIPGATVKTDKKEKQVAVIIMDKDFNYLGETVLGTWKEWHWENSFVTKEGLNIEYVGKDLNEDYLTLKVLTIKKISDEKNNI